MARYTQGFTLIELMVTISVAAILLTIALPSYRSFVLNSRMSAQSNDFLSALQLARSEAVKRGTQVSACKSADNTQCTTSGAWAQGWIVFVDGSTTGTVDGTDIVLRAFSALSGNSTLVGSANVADYVAYQANGATSLAVGANGIVSLCPTPGAVAGRDIQITASGRVRVQNPPAAVCP